MSLLFIKKTPILLFLLIFSQKVLSTEAVDIFDYSLQDLQTIKVKVATKSDIQLKYSPSSVSVFTQQQLSQLSIGQLADLADVSTGYSSYSIYGERVFETRGQKASSFENNKHLVLLDGIPLNHARANKAPIENELPLFIVEQVEMLSGPASSLYGVGAFYGVANLSSDIKESSSLAFKVKYQTQYHAQQAVFKSTYHHALGQSFFAGSFFDKQSSKQEVGPEFSPLQKYYDEQQADFYYLRHTFVNQLAVGVINLERTSGLGEHWNGDFSVPENNINWQTNIKFIQWPVALSQQLILDLQWVKNASTESGLSTTFTRQNIKNAPEQPIEFSRYKVKVESELLQAELKWNNTLSTEYLLGATYQKKSDLGGYINSGEVLDASIETIPTFTIRKPSSEVTLSAFYIQLSDELSTFWDLKLTAGLRYDHGEYQENHFSQTSPRASLVKEFNDEFLVRASYGSALRAPDLKEYLLNEESTQVIEQFAKSPRDFVAKVPKSLKAEIFDSYELALQYFGETSTSQLTLFRNKTQGVLDGQSIHFINSNGNEQVANSFINSTNKVNIWGVELSNQWFISPRWKVTGDVSFSYQVNETELALLDTPKVKANLYYYYRLSEATFYWQMQYRKYHSNEVPNYFCQNFGFNTEIYKNTHLTMKVKNLFNQQNYLPFNGELGNPLPERTLTASIEYKF
ncbi:TonB-dependent receptor plug domain-containing protein [Colwelliaceae bacterium 6441]